MGFSFKKKNGTQKEILDFSLWHIFLKMISPYMILLNDAIETLGTRALHAVLCGSGVGSGSGW